jgi:Uma2 family endonuclease
MTKYEMERKNNAYKLKEQREYYDPFAERYEIIGGVRYDMLSSPKLDHQLLVTQIWNALNQTCHASGIVVVAPMDVHLDDDNVVQPDLSYISEGNFGIIRGKDIYGAPDLLVEILSPSSGRHDKIRKRNVYEAFGVREYWIVDPIHKTIDQFVTDSGKLGLYKMYAEGDRLQSPVIACIDIDLDQLFLPLKRFDAEQ